MKKARLSLIIFVVLLTQACSTYTTNRYAINAGNVVALKNYKGSKIGVGEFTATDPGKKSVTCRAVGPIPTPDGETFENYIRSALISEMQIAEIYTEPGDVVLTGNLNQIKPSSTSGTWDISLTVNSSNGNSLTVDEQFKFKSSFYGETACNQTAQALMPAVQNVITQVVTHQNFPSLVQ